jgi:hypothetical protein
MKNNFSSYLWMLDNGARCHFCQYVIGLTKIKEINKSITIVNGYSMRASKIGNSNCEIAQLNGEMSTVNLNGVKCQIFAPI